METLRDMVDAEVERLWDELEDVPFSEDNKGEMRLDVDWYGFSAGATKNDVWSWFDRSHSKGINYLLNERRTE